MSNTFNKHREQFSKDKKDLDPNFKPETNIPANIMSVRSVLATRAQNPSGEDYAVFKLEVDVETEDGIKTKEWNISSETLVDTLTDKGVDIGSSFTVLKTGEGFKTKYTISNVVNKPVAQPTTQTPVNNGASAGGLSNASATAGGANSSPLQPKA